MNKKDYIDAMNELEVSENLKNETIHKMSEKPKKAKYNRIYPLASLAIMCAVIMAIVLPNRTIAPGEKPTIKDSEYIQQAGELPKVENFTNLYAILKERAGDDSRDYYYLDGIMTNETQEILEKSRTINATTDAVTTGQDYSKTNTQVEGVDEADIVKTDGRYIYYLKNDKLTIADTSNNKLVLTSKLTFDDEFYTKEIFVKDNKLIVLGTEMYRRKTKQSSNKYYYPSYNEYTVAKIYNIEDKSNIKEERTVEIEGNYLSSRMVGNNLYLISNEYNYNTWLCKEYEINELKENDFKPEYIDTVVSESIKYVDFDCIYYIPESEDTSYLNIASLDITKNEPANIESYLGAGNQIYASTNNIYVTKQKYNYERRYYETSTEIYKFELKDAKSTFVKSGTVPGTILNQFSMDEKDGYFRIATTTYGWSSDDNVNNMYVLDEKLEVVGKVEGLAEGEKIYSVRFMGDRAYMVTFVQTDPLFVIDLSIPTAPKVLGELKIPGYSKYLHPYDETHLIGIGEDTKVVNYGYGDIVKTNGMKMALFDVTDPTNPKEMYSVNIGKEGTYSEILNNHKALLFSKEKNIIAFPISMTSDEYEVTFQGAIVYGLSLDKGFELKGKISKYQQNEDSGYYNRANIDRIIYIQDTLYTLSKDLIKATNMNTMETKDNLSLR